jgi:hypothetical protein
MGKLGENVPLVIDKVVDFYGVQSGIYGVSEEITSPESRTGRDPGRESGDVSGAIKHYRKLYQKPVTRRKKFDGVISERLFSS